MSLRINNNIAAMNAYRNLSVTDSQMSSSLEKLSSGFRINKAADDAAGLSISEGLRAQIGGLQQAVRNAQDGVNVAQTADGALNETTAILQRMRDLAVQAANNGSQDKTAQAAANTEFTQLNKELDRIANTTSFGGQKLLDGNFKGGFQVGANATASDRINVDLSSAASFMSSTGTSVTFTDSVGGSGGSASVKFTGFDSSGLGTSSLDISNADSALAAVAVLSQSITNVSTARANIGAYQNRFEHTINNLNVAVQNLTASESQIRDTDMAQEMTNFTRTQILQQAGTAMLAQANQAPQSVLKLLG